MNNNYNEKSIQSLDYFEHIRKYPGMYIGSKDQRGLHHCIKEIISNSIDEWLNGSGNKIIINTYSDNSIEIIDNGRGIPHGKHENGMTLLSACFGVANTGGKFNNATGESGYNTSGGEHGTGGKAVNALSTKLIVTSSREGIKEISIFSRGVLLSETKEKIDNNITGTSVKFYPDPEIFETIQIDEKYVYNMIQEFSFLCKGLTFIYNDKTFLSKNGLYDYLNYLNKDKEIICQPFYFEETEDTYQIEVAFTYNNSYSSVIKLYTNNIPQEKGTHLTGFRTAYTLCLNNFAREKKWLKDKDSNLTGKEYEEGLILIINFKMIDPVFKGQNKEELSSSEGRKYSQKLTSLALTELFHRYEKDVKIIFDKAIKAKKAKEAAKKARDAVRNKSDKKKGVSLNLPTKLVDAWSKDRSTCELIISEGDSAASGLISGRDSEFQAVFPIRGKIINVFKASSEKIFANQEVINITKALGLTLDNKTHKLIYDEDRLRYGKILLACDADPDGQAIKNLLLTYFWWLCPELILNGHLYITIPPLFRVTNKKNEYIYLRDAAALAQYKEEHLNEKYIVSRNKGLGESDADELEECLLNPETRNVQQLTVDDIEAAAALFEIVSGKNADLRKRYIEEYGEEARA